MPWTTGKRNVGYGSTIEDQIVYTLKFVYKEIVLAHDRDNLEHVSCKIVEEYGKASLHNLSKTKYLCVGIKTLDLA